MVGGLIHVFTLLNKGAFVKVPERQSCANIRSWASPAQTSPTSAAA